MEKGATSTTESRRPLLPRNAKNTGYNHPNEIKYISQGKMATMEESNDEVMAQGSKGNESQINHPPTPPQITAFSPEIPVSSSPGDLQPEVNGVNRLSEEFKNLRDQFAETISKFENRILNLLNEHKKEMRNEMEDELMKLQKKIEMEHNSSQTRLKKEFQEGMDKMKLEHQTDIKKMEKIQKEQQAEIDGLKKDLCMRTDTHKKQEAKMNRIIEQSNNRERENMKNKCAQLQNNIIISGSPVSAAIENCDPLIGIRQLLKDKLRMTDSDLGQIVSARKLGRNQEVNNKLLLEVRDPDVKAEIRHRMVKTVRPADIYFSEHLLPEVSNLLYNLRKIKRESASFSTLFTRNGEIIVKKSQTGNSYKILTEWDMEKFFDATGLHGSDN